MIWLFDNNIFITKHFISFQVANINYVKVKNESFDYMFLSFSIRLCSKKSILFCPFLDQNDSLGEMLSLTVLFLPQFMLTRQKTNLVNFDRTNLAVFFFKLAASLILEMEEKIGNLNSNFLGRNVKI